MKKSRCGATDAPTKTVVSCPADYIDVFSAARSALMDYCLLPWKKCNHLSEVPGSRAHANGVILCTVLSKES